MLNSVEQCPHPGHMAKVRLAGKSALNTYTHIEVHHSTGTSKRHRYSRFFASIVLCRRVLGTCPHMAAFCPCRGTSTAVSAHQRMIFFFHKVSGRALDHLPHLSSLRLKSGSLALAQALDYSYVHSAFYDAFCHAYHMVAFKNTSVCVSLLRRRFRVDEGGGSKGIVARCSSDF